MTPQDAVKKYLDNGRECPKTEITRHLRSAFTMTHNEAQAVLYGMVKTKEVVWNNEMGRAGRYRLSPNATVTATAPNGRAERASGIADRVYWGVHDARMAKTYEVLMDDELRWLADKGYLGLNKSGRQWYEGHEPKREA